MKVEKPRKNGDKQRSTQMNEHDGEQKSCASDAQTDSGSSCSTHDCRKVLQEDVELAQSLIERCLQLYMTQDEVVAVLVNRVKLEPGFITLVWQKLEEENAEFFKAYYARLKLKKQITIFNLLLERQHHLMNFRETPNNMPNYLHNGILDVSGGSVKSPMGYLPPQLPCILSNDHTYMESLQYGGPSYMGVRGVPALGSFDPPTEVAAVDIDTAAGIKQEMGVSCLSTESNGQFSFAPEDILRMSVDPMTFDAPLSSNMCSTEGLQLAPDDGHGNFVDNSNSHLAADFTNSKGDMLDFGALGSDPSSFFSLSDIDTLLNSPDRCDIVDHFIVDTDPN